jgi:hypothetical protein
MGVLRPIFNVTKLRPRLLLCGGKLRKLRLRCKTGSLVRGLLGLRGLLPPLFLYSCGLRRFRRSLLFLCLRCLRTAGVSATEHGRAQATVEQLQGRVEELEEELTSAREVLPPLTWHRAMRFLLDAIPEVGVEIEREDWPPEFAELVRQISEARGLDFDELFELELRIKHLRAAVASVEDDEADAEATAQEARD